MIKKLLLISLILMLFNFTVKTQNIECIDNLISIPLAGYKAGNIQWQFSTNQTNWTDIENQNSASLSYHIQETGYFRAEIIDLACTYYSDTVFIQAFPYPTVANAGPDQSYVDGTTSVTLAANIPEAGLEIGYWNIVSGEGGSFVDSTDAGTVFTGSHCTDYTLHWTIATPCSNSSDDVLISFNQVPTVSNAGPDQNFDDGTLTATLSGNIPEAGHGTGYWRSISGEIGSLVDSMDAETVFTGNQCNDYTLLWTITTPCSNSSDDVVISFVQVPTVSNAGPDQSFDDGTLIATLSGNIPEAYHGTGYWNIVSGEGGSFVDSTDAGTTFSGQHCTDYTLRWTIATPCTSSTDDVIIGFHQVPTVADAGPDQSYDDGTISVTLAGNEPEAGHGTGYWSIVSGEGGSFVDSTDAGTTFSGQHCTDYTLRWTIATPCTSSTDDVIIGFHQVPTVADAGPDQSYDDGTISVTLAGNEPEAGHGTGFWSIVSGEGGSFVDSTDAGTVFNGKLFEIYSLKWNIITECGRSEDDVKISYIDSLGDFDGNKYKTVVIGDQIWMAENLKVTHYDNGTSIPLENYSNANIDLYGIYYKPLVGLNNSESSIFYPSGVQGACPSNWHIPSPSEWEELINYTGNNAQVLKSTTGWSGDNNGLDTYSFSILPAGKGFITGEIVNVGQEASILTTRYEYGSIFIILFSSYYDERIDITMDIMDDIGVSIRCVKD